MRYLRALWRGINRALGGHVERVDYSPEAQLRRFAERLLAEESLDERAARRPRRR